VVLVGGAPTLGVTPLVVDDFAPGGDVSLTLRKTGYQDEKVVVRVPAAGGHADIARELSFAQEVASIVVTSEPSGADVYLDGQREVGMTTPTTEILVEAGKKHAVRLELAGHAPVTVTVTPGRGARGVPVQAKLVRATSISVTSNVEGRVTIDKASCDKVATPASCSVTKGHYQVQLETSKMPGTFYRDVDVAGDAPITVAFNLGIVEAPRGKVLVIAGHEAPRAAFDVPRAGKKITVTVKDRDGTETDVEVRVEAGKTRKAE
jgi:hypothetical protein